MNVKIEIDEVILATILAVLYERSAALKVRDAGIKEQGVKNVTTDVISRYINQEKSIVSASINTIHLALDEHNKQRIKLN
jgi:hypothetical protein